MKTKFYFLVISLLAICSVCLPACDNDEKGDVTKPVIDLIEPEEGAVLKIGNGKGVHFEMNLSDDVMLRSYKINIHNNFDVYSRFFSAFHYINRLVHQYILEQFPVSSHLLQFLS